MDELAKYLAEIEAFLVEHDMKHTVFARAATRDKSYVDRLRKGSGTNIQEVNKLMKQFDEMRKMMKMMGNKDQMKNMMRSMPGMRR